jgi:hypothetical protein
MARVATLLCAQLRMRGAHSRRQIRTASADERDDDQDDLEVWSRAASPESPLLPRTSVPHLLSLAASLPQRSDNRVAGIRHDARQIRRCPAR